MRRSDYEWAYFIGGNCALRPNRHGGRAIARVDHIEQDQYEANILRWHEAGESPSKWSLGVFNSPEEAEAVIEKVLEDVWEK